MSKEWVYKVSESIVFFTASTPFPWHFCHLSPLHNKDLERAERSLQLPRSQHGKPFPAWNEPPSGLYDILCAGKKKRMGEGSHGKAQQLLGKRCPWQVYPQMSVYSRIFLPKPGVLPWGSSCSSCSWETLSKLPMRLQSLSLNAAISTLEMIPSIPRNSLFTFTFASS